MSFLGFGRRGREHEHAHERERPERNWRERTHDWGEQRFRSDDRFARNREPGRDIGDYYGPERYGARRPERSDELGSNRGEWPRRGEGERNRNREQGTHGAYWSPERTSFSDFGRERSSAGDYGRSGERERSTSGDFGRSGERSAYGVGHFRGKGPKGYRRSDERIREDVCECLTEDDYIDASNVEVQVKECEVTLSGTVNSREEKRRAEDLIDCLAGVRDVNNNLRVVNEGGMMQRREETQTQTRMRETEQGPRH